jgi:hypothetical protein
LPGTSNSSPEPIRPFFFELAIAMARGHSTILFTNLLYTLLRSVYAFDMGANFFEEQQQALVCQVYTLLESPIVIETFLPFNTVLSNSACDCEITVTNAPTLLIATVTVTQTLGRNVLSSSSENMLSSAYVSLYSITWKLLTAFRGANMPNIPDDRESPKYYIIVTETHNNKRQSLQGPNYLKGDGSLTSDPSQAVQIYEWSGQLFTINGAPNGTYFANVTVETITLESQPFSSFTSNSIAGHFNTGGQELTWENELFANSRAIFALSPEGIVKAIFDGKLSKSVKVVGLVLTRVGDEPLVPSPSRNSSKGTKTIAGSSTSLGAESMTAGGASNDFSATGTADYHSPVRQDASSGDITKSTSVPPKVLPALSNAKPASSNKITSSPSTKAAHTSKMTNTLRSSPQLTFSTSVPTSTPSLTSSSSCTTLSSSSGGGLPSTLGLAILASPPNWPFSYTVRGTTFALTFGIQTSVGSLAYAELDPSAAPGDSILYYQLNTNSTAKTLICETWGYLYH